VGEIILMYVRCATYGAEKSYSKLDF
jgi:hypothetical protein